MKALALLPLLALTGCAVTLPFNNRLSYEVVSTAKALNGTQAGPIQLIWEPSSFPGRIDTQGASGFVGVASQTRIPTGVAIASRVNEGLDMAMGVAPGAPRKLTIKIIKAKSTFQYSAGIFNVTPVIDTGGCTFEAAFSCGDIAWTGSYKASSKDKAIGGSSSTGVLEKVWDDIAMQVCTDVVSHLAPAGAAPASR